MSQRPSSSKPSYEPSPAPSTTLSPTLSPTLGAPSPCPSPLPTPAPTALPTKRQLRGLALFVRTVRRRYGVGVFVLFGAAVSMAACLAGQDKRAKFPTSKAHISAVFHSFRLIFGRAIIFRNGLEAWMLFFERARAEHTC